MHRRVRYLLDFDLKICSGQVWFWSVNFVIKLARFRSLTQGNVLPFFNVSKKGRTLQNISLHQRPDPVLLTLPQATSIRVITFDQHLPRVFGKSGFFRQQLMTSISRQRLNFRNAHQDLTADLYPWYRDLIWKNWFSRTKISFSFFTFGTLSIHKRRRCDRKMSYTDYRYNL